MTELLACPLCRMTMEAPAPAVTELTCPGCAEPIAAADLAEPTADEIETHSTGRVGGPAGKGFTDRDQPVHFNVNLKDNVIQLLIVFVCTFAGVIVGALSDRSASSVTSEVSAIEGGLLGLVVGLVVSSIVLMITKRNRGRESRESEASSIDSNRS